MKRAYPGVMIRESLAPDARHVFALVTPGNGVVAHARPNTGSATTITAGPWWASAPYWLKVSRSGTTFTTSASENGTTWSVISIETVAMGTNAYIGIAVTSHNTAQATSVAASNVDVTRR